MPTITAAVWNGGRTGLRAGAPAPRRPGRARGARPDGRSGRLPQRLPRREGRVGAPVAVGARPRGRGRRRGGRPGRHDARGRRPRRPVVAAPLRACVQCLRGRYVLCEVANRTNGLLGDGQPRRVARRRGRPRWAGSARSPSRRSCPRPARSGSPATCRSTSRRWSAAPSRPASGRSSTPRRSSRVDRARGRLRRRRALRHPRRGAGGGEPDHRRRRDRREARPGPPARRDAHVRRDGRQHPRRGPPS